MSTLMMVGIVLAVHFVADFVLQSDWMAVNKSSKWPALWVHVTVYTVCFVPVFYDRPQSLVLVFWTHFATDAITSRITSRLWKAQERHWFFVVIGADQLIHQVTLLWLLWLKGS